MHLFALIIMASSQAFADELLRRWKGPREQILSLYCRTMVYRPQFLQFKQRLPVTTYKLIYTQQLETPCTPDWGPADFQCCWKDEDTVGFSFIYAGTYLFFCECNIRKQAPRIFKEQKKWRFTIEIERALTFEDIVSKGKRPETFLVKVVTKDGKRWRIFKDNTER